MLLRADAVAHARGQMPLTKKDKEEIAEMIAEALNQESKSQKVWGKGVATRELKCGLTIAMEDYWELDEDGQKKTEFTYDEAMEIEKKTGGKWRVPTVVEWLQIVLELGTTEDGGLDRDKLVGELNLTEDEGRYGYYWSSTVVDGNDAYSLSYGSGVLYPAYQYSRYRGWSVRCVSA